MEFDKKAFDTKKYIAIALMALAFLFLCMNWIKIGKETRKEIKESRRELEDEIDYEMERYDADDLEDLFDEEGYSSKESKKMAKATEALLSLMEKGEKGKASVFTMIGIASDLSDIKKVTADDDLYFASGEETIIMVVVSVLLYVIIVLFIVDGALMLFAIFCYVKEKKAFGVISAVLSGLMFLGFGSVMLLIKIGSEDMGTGITFAPVLTLAFAIASCVVWRSARKMQEVYKFQSMMMV